MSRVKFFLKTLLLWTAVGLVGLGVGTYIGGVVQPHFGSNSMPVFVGCDCPVVGDYATPKTDFYAMPDEGSAAPTPPLPSYVVVEVDDIANNLTPAPAATP